MPSKDGATKKPWQDLPLGRIPTDKTVTRKLTRYASFFSRLYSSNLSKNRSISFFCK